MAKSHHVRLCPVCRRAIDPLSKVIFCSERCRVIDLSRWLNEEYRIRGGEEGEEGMVIHSTDPGAPEKDEGDSSTEY